MALKLVSPDISHKSEVGLVAPASADPGGRLAILPYPDQLERQVDSAIGPLTIRPIRLEDADAHVAFFEALSAEDIHMRMFGAMRRLSRAQLARFTQIDYAREMAFIASRPLPDGAETLGVARVAIDPDGVNGEFAIVVRTDLKGRGLGSLLFDCLLDYCRARSLCTVEGVTLPANTAMQALARAKGFMLHSDADGMVTMTLRLGGG